MYEFEATQQAVNERIYEFIRIVSAEGSEKLRSLKPGYSPSAITQLRTTLILGKAVLCSSYVNGASNEDELKLAVMILEKLVDAHDNKDLNSLLLIDFTNPKAPFIRTTNTI